MPSGFLWHEPLGSSLCFVKTSAGDAEIVSVPVEAVSQNVNRNPSWTNRWKFDCPSVLRLMRPKSADVVLR
jgi:hypothetical protein